MLTGKDELTKELAQTTSTNTTMLIEKCDLTNELALPEVKENKTIMLTDSGELTKELALTRLTNTTMLIEKGELTNELPEVTL